MCKNRAAGLRAAECCGLPSMSIAPTVPRTQYPGSNTRFSGPPAHSFKAFKARPPWSIPGVASSTMGVGDVSTSGGSVEMWEKSKAPNSPAETSSQRATQEVQKEANSGNFVFNLLQFEVQLLGLRTRPRRIILDLVSKCILLRICAA